MAVIIKDKYLLVLWKGYAALFGYNIGNRNWARDICGNNIRHTGVQSDAWFIQNLQPKTSITIPILFEDLEKSFCGHPIIVKDSKPKRVKNGTINSEQCIYHAHIHACTSFWFGGYINHPSQPIERIFSRNWDDLFANRLNRVGGQDMPIYQARDKANRIRVFCTWFLSIFLQNTFEDRLDPFCHLFWRGFITSIDCSTIPTVIMNIHLFLPQTNCWARIVIISVVGFKEDLRFQIDYGQVRNVWFRGCIKDSSPEWVQQSIMTLAII